MDFMARAAATPLLAVDVDVVEVAIAVAESRERGRPFVGREAALVALETEVVARLFVRRVERIGERLAEQIRVLG